MTARLCVGLTGGIGSGKTTVSEEFAQLGVPVIDADVISRQVTRQDGAAFKPVTELFGQDVIGVDGELRRDKIRDLVFNSPDLRQQLEAIIHPLVRKEINKSIEQADYPYCIVSIPLLLETGSREYIDRILVVDIPEIMQETRASERDNADPTSIKKIIASQINRQERLEAANDIIYNDKDLAYLRQQVHQLHDKYLVLAETLSAKTT